MAQEFVNNEYPKGQGETNRQFDYNSYRELYPVPYDEIIKNNEIDPEDQNSGY